MRQAIHTVVAAMAKNQMLHDESYLKGGILLALRYESARHTTDLDFSNVNRYSDELGGRLLQALRATLPGVVEALGYDLDCRIQSTKVQPSPEHTYVNLEMKIGYAKKGTPAHRRLERGQAADTISIDYNFCESVPEEELIEIEGDGTLRVYGMTTLIAEKYRAMLQQPLRNRVRRQDVFDLNFLLERCGPIEWRDKQRVLSAIVAKCEERGFTATCDSMSNEEIYERTKAQYPSLEAEVPGELPDFEDSFQRVRSFYESLPWRAVVPEK